ncbi:hypothetical protein [Neisseria montereyensis]|uniref:Uncharacterized protein n=1 Tax=Neisseria montereyensis TaxID=2973938 RepID=A0ABT2FAC8_9NEIS|nr:hypothetical protein [Neisseria montereyensis]MCS4533117.1 hypothetical protein [Neisseria montereyensis]
MKKTMLTFAALATLVTSFASAKGAHMPAYNHANDSGSIAGLEQVPHNGPVVVTKDDDVVRFVFPGNTDTKEIAGYEYLGRTEPR